MATRRPATNIPTNSNGCRGFLSIRGSGSRPRSRWCWPAISTSSRPPPTSTTPRPGSMTPCSARRPARAFQSLLGLGLTDALRAVTDAAGAVHVLGLSGRRLAEELGPADRPPAAVAAGQRPAGRCRHRQLCAGLGEAVRPRAGLGGSRSGDGLRPARPGVQSRRPLTQCSSICSAMARSFSDALASARL